MPFEHDIGDFTPEIKKQDNFTLSDIDFDDIGFHPVRNRVYVYVIVCLGTPFLKVGISANPRKRVVAMQTGNPMTLKLAHVQAFSSSEIALQVENRMHFLLGALNQSGEWFQASIPYVSDALEKASKQVKNKRGELGWKPNQRRKVMLDWNYSE